MLRKFTVLLAVSAITFITGCGGPQPTWRKEGISSEGAYSAFSECKYQVGLNKISQEKQKELIRNCMEGKGFRWR